MAVLDQDIERPQGLFHRRGRIEPVQLVEIDVVGLEPLQAGLDAVDDMGSRTAATVRPLRGFPEHLGGQHHVVARDAEPVQRLTRDLFGQAFRIDVGRIDEVDPLIDRCLDQGLGLALLQRADLAPHLAAAAERHGAEAEFRHEEAGAAQSIVAQGGILPDEDGGRKATSRPDDEKRAPQMGRPLRTLGQSGNQAAFDSTTFGARALVPIGICRGFWASGISRTRSTWSSPCSRAAPVTWTWSASWKRRSNARAAMPW